MNLRWPLVIALLSIAATLVVADSALAQSRSTGSTTSRSTGATTTTSGLFGQNSVGGTASTQAPSSSGGSSGGNTSGSTGGTADQNVALSARNIAPTVTTVQQRGAFVGADRSDTTNARSLQGTNAQSGQSGNNGLAQLQNLFSQGLQNVNRGNQTTGQVQIPVALKLGFAPHPVSPGRIQAFQTRLTKLPSIHFVGPASVTLEGRTAVLRGMVATAEDRELAEAVAMMEPDVRDVRNELTVDSSARAAEELPTVPATNSP
jgi:hypothetical protein